VLPAHGDVHRPGDEEAAASARRGSVTAAVRGGPWCRRRTSDLDVGRASSNLVSAAASSSRTASFIDRRHQSPTNSISAIIADVHERDFVLTHTHTRLTALFPGLPG